MDLFGPSGGGYSHHPPAQQTAYPPLTDASYGGGSTHPQPSTPGNPPTSSSSASSFAPAAPPPSTSLQTMRTNARKSFAEQVRAFSHLDDVSTELSEMPKIKFKNRLFVLERWLNRPRARTSSIAEHGEFLMEVRARDGGAYEPVEPVWACTVGDCNHDLFSAKASSAALMHLEKRHGIVKTGGGRKRMAAAAAREEAEGEGEHGGDGGGSGGVVEVLDTLASGGPPRKRMVLAGGGVPDKSLGKLMKELAEERARNAALRQELDDQRRRYEDELRVQRERHMEEMRLERERFSKNEDRLWRMIEKANED